MREIKRYVKMKAEVDMLEYIAVTDYVASSEELSTIYDLALVGMSMREIGKHMCTDRRTVTKRIEDIFKVAMQTELVETWLMYGVVDTFE